MSVEAGSRARPPRSWPSSSRVLTRLPLWPMAIARRGPWPVRRLGVLPDRRAGRRVAAVGDGQVAAQAGQAPLVEDRADHPEVLVEHQLLAVADRDAGRFLAAVLEREQAERRDGGRLGRARRPAATAPNTPHIAVSPPSRAPGPGRGPRRGAGRRPAPRARRRRGCRAPRRRRSLRPPASSIDEAVAADRARAPRPAGRAGGPAARAPGANRGRAVTTRRDGLSPNSSTAGELPTGEPDARAAARPTSRSRRGRPRDRRRTRPGRDATSPRAMASRMNAWSAASRARSRAGGPSSTADAGERGVGGAGQARRGARRRAGSRRRRPTNAGPTSGRDVVEQPDDPDLGRRRDRAGRATRCRARRCRR